MARSSYSLQIFKTINLKSLNGSTYSARIWYSSANTGEWRIAQNGLKLDWESENVQDKNSPILASKLTLDVLVEDSTQENQINAFNEDPERSVWVTLNEGATVAGSVLWSGYLIANFDVRDDLSYPYVSTLVFVDGIASLKEIPFLRETNSETSAVPSFPYVKADTFANAGYKEIVGTTSSWLKLILDNTGMVLESDEVSSGAGLANYLIQTAVNWWNEDMDVTPEVATCPLTKTRINVTDFYEVSDENKYTPPDSYSVLKSICKSFNMRMFYWEHTFHFIQVSEYNTNEEGVAPYTTPINIPTREFYHTGTFRTSRNYFGTKNFSIYNQVIENGTTNGGLQKLATTTYEALPAIKRTLTYYAEFAGGNYFNGFPLFLTHNTVSGLPTTWPTDNASHTFTQFSQTGQEYNVMTLTDANQLSGFNCRIYLTFTNSANADLHMTLLFTIRAKPSTSAWGDTDNMTLYKDNTNELKWKINEFPLLNNQEYIRHNTIIPNNCNDKVMNVFDGSTNHQTIATDNLLPTDSAFTESWDFQFYTFTEYDNDATRPMYAYTQQSAGNSGYSHGGINAISLGATNSAGAAATVYKTPTFYAFDYLDTLSTVPNGGVFFESLFVPVKTGGISFGNNTQEIQVAQSGDDKFEYNVGTIAFGDGSGADTNSTFQVYDGSDWVYVSPFGKWAKGIYTWNGSAFVYSALTYDKKSQVLVGEEIMNNQSETILTFSGTTALSSVDKYYSGTTKLKFMNPCSRMVDSDGKKYMMMRSTFNIVNDEWNGQWAEVSYQVPTTVTIGSANRKAGEGLPAETPVTN